MSQVNPTEFAIFKYRHGDPAIRRPLRQTTLYISLLVAAVVTVMAFPGGAVLFLLPAVVYLSNEKHLCLGPRYLLCGGSVVYYGNVVRMSLDETVGKLTVKSANGKTFVLERDKFPTNARKPAKVAANKAAKFEKISGKIIEKVRRVSPNVELVGIQDR